MNSAAHAFPSARVCEFDRGLRCRLGPWFATAVYRLWLQVRVIDQAVNAKRVLHIDLETVGGADVFWSTAVAMNDGIPSRKYLRIDEMQHFSSANHRTQKVADRLDQDYQLTHAVGVNSRRIIACHAEVSRLQRMRVIQRCNCGIDRRQ
jgi:hypothetical protein